MGKRVEIVQIKADEIEEIDVQLAEREEKLKTKNSVSKTVSNLLSRMSLRKSSIPSAPTYPLAPHDDESETTFSNAAQPTQKYLERMEEKGQENIRVGKGSGADGIEDFRKDILDNKLLTVLDTEFFVFNFSSLSASGISISSISSAFI